MTPTLPRDDWFTPGAVETLVTRVDAPRAKLSVMNDMIVERGDGSDWELLHDLHYKAENLPIGPRFWKCTLEGKTIGVLVTGNPRGMIKERHLAFPNIKPGAKETKATNTARYNFINGNIRVVARFVVDTMFRGVGVGYRMMNLVSRMEGNTFMEIQSSMSKFNYFGQKAGFRFVKPTNSTFYHQGLKFFRSQFSASPQDYEAIIEELDAMSPTARAEAIAACKHYYYHHSALEQTGSMRETDASGLTKGQRRVEAMTARMVIKALQQMTLASPMYGVWKNPDKGRTLPARIPLTAFDNQGPNEPFKDLS